MLLVVGLLLAVELLSNWHPDRYWAIQRAGFVFANRALDHLPASVWTYVSMLGDGGVLLCLGSPLLLWRPQAWAAMLAAAPFAALLSATAKHVFEMPRPAVVLDPQTFTIIGHTLTSHNSLPSGHAITIFAGVIAVLAVLAPCPRRWGERVLVLAGLVIATILCVSRIAVGAHWPLDVVAGAAGGWFAGLIGAALTRRYRGWWQFTKRSGSRYVLATLLLVLSVWMFDRVEHVSQEAFMVWLSGLTGVAVSVYALASLPSLRRGRTGTDTRAR